MKAQTTDRRPRSFAAIAITALTCLATTVATAGVAIESETTKPGGESERATMLIDGRNLRIETDRQGGDTVIFNGAKHELIVVNTKDESYMVLDRAAMTQLGDSLNQAQKMMEERLASMPTKQREMVEKMMKQQGMMPGTGQAKPPKKVETSVKNTGEKKTIDGKSTVRHDLYRGEVKVAEAWLTSFSNAGVSDDTFKVFEDMGAFFDELMAELGSNPMFEQMVESGGIMSGLNQLGGFPLEIREIENGKTSSETKIVATHQRDLGPETFEPPTGYKARALPTGPGGQ